NLVLDPMGRVVPCDARQPSTFSSCLQRIQYVDQNGQLGGEWRTSAQAVNIGVFIQDRWTIKRLLTIVPGFRFDPDGLIHHQGAQQLYGYGPRLSVIYDLLHDRSTMISAHYGRHNDVGNAFIADRGNPFQVSSLQRWDGATQQFQTSSQSGGPGGQRFADSL